MFALTKPESACRLGVPRVWAGKGAGTGATSLQNFPLKLGRGGENLALVCIANVSGRAARPGLCSELSPAIVARLEEFCLCTRVPGGTYLERARCKMQSDLFKNYSFREECYWGVCSQRKAKTCRVETDEILIPRG